MRVASTARNIAANYFGNLIALVLGLAVVPLYLRFMGVAAYGLVGMFAALQSVFAILDLGLGSTFIREIARLRAMEDNMQLHRVFRAFEAIFIAMAAGIALIVILGAPLITQHWMRDTSLPQNSVTMAVRLMGLAIAVYWPFSLYAGGISGLQRMVPLNVIVTGITIVRSVGSVLVLWLVSPTIEAFFLFQVAANLMQTLIAGCYLKRILPPCGERVGLHISSVRHLVAFASGLGATAVLSVILTQLDKLILTRMLSLEAFGYYALASTAASSLYRLTVPISSALYPRMNEVALIGGKQDLIRLYHKSCQLMSVIVLPLAITISVFSVEILWVWTGNYPVASITGHFLRLLILGTAANALMYVPYQVQLVYGSSYLAFYVNVVSVCLLAPMTILLVPLWGGIAAAGLWLALNLGYLVIGMPVMHLVILRKNDWSWHEMFRFYGGVLSAVAGIALISVTAKLVMPPHASKSFTVTYVTCSGFLALAWAVLASDQIRTEVMPLGKRLCSRVLQVGRA